MALMPGATWRGPVPNMTKRGQAEVRGIVLHIMDGTLVGTDSWFKNPAAKASSHFGVGKAGQIYQWVDTADRAWAQAEGNTTWLSIEHEGKGGEALTAAQIEADAKIMAWAHATHNVPLTSTDSPSGRGLGWHGMGGAAWGTHPSCPGEKIKAQRPAILARAAQLAGTPSTPIAAGPEFPGDQAFEGHAALGAWLTQLALRSAGYPILVTGTWNAESKTAYAAYQRSLGYTGADADGVPGPTSWAKALEALRGKVA